MFTGGGDITVMPEGGPSLSHIAVTSMTDSHDGRNNDDENDGGDQGSSNQGCNDGESIDDNNGDRDYGKYENCLSASIEKQITLFLLLCSTKGHKKLFASYFNMIKYMQNYFHQALLNTHNRVFGGHKAYFQHVPSLPKQGPFRCYYWFLY